MNEEMKTEILRLYTILVSENTALVSRWTRKLANKYNDDSQFLSNRTSMNMEMRRLLRNLYPLLTDDFNKIEE